LSELTGEVVDPISILVQYLLDQSDMTDLVEQRIYGGGLPPNSSDYDNAITIRQSGGPTELDQETIAWPRFEIRCYGRTDEEAAEVFWRLYRLINGKLNLMANDGRILSIWLNGAGIGLYDETVNRPFRLAFAQSIVQTEAVSA
jgi:hypothetical protein